MAACNKMFKPVCDDRNQTHNNLCLFEYSACLARYREGVDLQVRLPSAIWFKLNRRTIQITSDGPCAGDVPKVAEEGPLEVEKAHGETCEWECGHEFEPVCDTQGRTHINECEFEKQKCRVEMRSQGTETLMV